MQRGAILKLLVLPPFSMHLQWVTLWGYGSCEFFDGPQLMVSRSGHAWEEHKHLQHAIGLWWAMWKGRR